MNRLTWRSDISDGPSLMVEEVVMLIEMMGDEVGEEADGSAKEEGLVSVMVVVTAKVFVEMMVYVRL